MGYFWEPPGLGGRADREGNKSLGRWGQQAGYGPIRTLCEKAQFAGRLSRPIEWNSEQDPLVKIFPRPIQGLGCRPHVRRRGPGRVASPPGLRLTCSLSAATWQSQAGREWNPWGGRAAPAERFRGEGRPQPRCRAEGFGEKLHQRPIKTAFRARKRPRPRRQRPLHPREIADKTNASPGSPSRRRPAGIDGPG